MSSPEQGGRYFLLDPERQEQLKTHDKFKCIMLIPMKFHSLSSDCSNLETKKAEENGLTMQLGKKMVQCKALHLHLSSSGLIQLTLMDYIT